MNQRAPTIIVKHGHRVIDRNDLANLVTLREGKLVSCDRSQVGEIIGHALDAISQVWETDPVAVAETLEQQLRERKKRS